MLFGRLCSHRCSASSGSCPAGSWDQCTATPGRSLAVVPPVIYLQHHNIIHYLLLYIICYIHIYIYMYLFIILIYFVLYFNILWSFTLSRPWRRAATLARRRNRSPRPAGVVGWWYSWRPGCQWKTFLFRKSLFHCVRGLLHQSYVGETLQTHVREVQFLTVANKACLTWPRPEISRSKAIGSNLSGPGGAARIHSKSRSQQSMAKRSRSWPDNEHGT